MGPCCYIWFKRPSTCFFHLLSVAMGKSKKDTKRKSGKASRKRQRSSSSSSSSNRSESDGSSSCVSADEKKHLQILHRSAGYLGKIPKVRLQGMLKAADSRLDSFWSSRFDIDNINRVLWMLTKISPITRVGNLQVKTYREANKKC